MATSVFHSILICLIPGEIRHIMTLLDWCVQVDVLCTFSLTQSFACGQKGSVLETSDQSTLTVRPANMGCGLLAFCTSIKNRFMKFATNRCSVNKFSHWSCESLQLLIVALLTASMASVLLPRPTVLCVWP